MRVESFDAWHVHLVFVLCDFYCRGASGILVILSLDQFLTTFRIVCSDLYRQQYLTTVTGLQSLSLFFFMKNLHNSITLDITIT